MNTITIPIEEYIKLLNYRLQVCTQIAILKPKWVPDNAIRELEEQIERIKFSYIAGDHTPSDIEEELNSRWKQVENISSNNKSQAYMKGYTDYGNRGINNNPYPLPSMNASEWIRGWYQRQNEVCK